MASKLSVALEAIDGADLGQQFRGGHSCAAGQLEQRWGCRCGPLFELAVELDDRPGERAATSDELACEAYLQLLVATREAAADAFQVG